MLAPTVRETSARRALLDSFLQPTHGDLKSTSATHQAALEHDPLLYAHLSRWYQQHGTLRDHHVLFAAHLLHSVHPEFRQHAAVLMQLLRPYQAATLVRYCKEQLGRASGALRTAVRFFLKRREADPLWFDECVLRDRRSIKYLYATMHVKPDARAQQVLFEERPPHDSRLHVVSQLHRASPAQQAEWIKAYRIQFTTAMGAIKQLSPEVLLALIEVMTPQQAINNLVFLNRRGALQQPAARQLVLRKIREGETESRVHDAKGMVALRHLHNDPELKQQLLQMTEFRFRQRGRLTRPTALLIDKSGSMDVCLDLGLLAAVLVSSVADAPLYVQAFDSDSFPITPKTLDVAGWQQAFQHLRADGCTSIGAPLRKLQTVEFEQILLISDGGENQHPYFCQELQQYERQHGRKVQVFWVKIGRGHTVLERNAEEAQVHLETFPFRGDYYNLPNLVSLLCHHQSDDTFVDQVMECPLYGSDDLQRLPPAFDPVTCEVL